MIHHIRESFTAFSILESQEKCHAKLVQKLDNAKQLIDSLYRTAISPSKIHDSLERKVEPGELSKSTLLNSIKMIAPFLTTENKTKFCTITGKKNEIDGAENTMNAAFELAASLCSLTL